jgi:hypothetical protein
VDDGKADDEDADAHEDLDAAFLGLEANVPRSGEKQHHGERVQAVHEPVSLGLCERGDERDDPDCR